jgi:peroxiredoxin
LRRDHQRFLAAGTALVVVGQGTPEQTTAFVRRLGLPYPVLSDPERAAYAAYGLIEGGPKAFLTPAAGRAFLRSLLDGAGGGRVVGNPRELGGAFVVDRAGIVRYAKPAAYAGDHASTGDLLAAVRDLATA